MAKHCEPRSAVFAFPRHDARRPVQVSDAATRRWSLGLIAVIALSLGPALSGEAVGQTVNSDYMAYPKNMTLMDYMVRKDLLNLTFARWPGLFSQAVNTAAPVR